MTRRIIYGFVFTAILFHIAVFVAFSQEPVWLGFSKSTAAAPDDRIPFRTVHTDSNEKVSVAYRFSGVYVVPIPAGHDTLRMLRLPGFGQEDSPGEAQLPVRNELVAVPSGRKPILKITAFSYRDIPMQKLMAVNPPDREDRNIIHLPERFIRDTDRFYPDESVRIRDIQKFRGQSIALVKIVPFRYNPVTQTLRVLTSLSWEITFVPDERTVKKSAPKGLQSSIEKKYVIITHSKYADAAHRMAAWKACLGFDTKIYTAEIWTPSAIRDSLTNYINTQGIPDYFLIIGDQGDVPAEYRQSPPDDENGNFPVVFPTDLYYTCLDGTDDYFPDIAHGRISVTTQGEAESVVNKIIHYEKNPPEDPDFYQQALVCGQYQDDDLDEHADRRFTHTNEDVRNYLTTLGYNVDRVYSTKNSVQPWFYNLGIYSNGEALPAELRRDQGFNWDGDADDIIDRIREGRFFVFYRGHGNSEATGWVRPSFTTLDIPLMDNGNLQPVVSSVNCYTGMFSKESFAEKLLRNGDGGAVGVIAPTCFSFSGYNDALASGFVDALWPDPGLIPRFGSGGVINPECMEHGEISALGDVVIQGLLRMTELWSRTSHIRYQFELYHYFGDPAMKLYKSLPSGFEVTDVSPVNPDTDSVRIQVDNCPGALITVTSGEKILASDTISGTMATLHFDVSGITDTAYVTVSHEGFRPWQMKISDPVTGIGGKRLFHGIRIFPNPVKEVLHISLPDKVQSPLRLMIYSPDGKKLYEEYRLSGKDVLLKPGHLHPGIYWINVMDTEGKRFSAPFIKE